MYQELINALIRAQEVPASTTTAIYAPTKKDLFALRTEEMVTGRKLRLGERRKYLSEISDEKFFAMLPADMRGQLEKFVDDGSTNINRWIARDAILETACHYYYAKGDGGPVLSPGNWLRGDWLRDATVDHLCLAGYSEPVAKKIVSTAGAPLALASVKWARDAFQKKLETYPKLSPKRTETWKLTRKGLRIALMCMLDGMVGRAKENHLSQNLIRVSLRVQGYNLPKTPNLQTRVAIIGFLEAAQISLETMPHELVK